MLSYATAGRSKLAIAKLKNENASGEKHVLIDWINF